MNAALPSEQQFDALREVANVGCGHAASALAKLMGRKRVDLSVPRALVLAPAEVPALLGGAHRPVVAAQLGLAGALKGLMLMVLPEADGYALTDLLLGGPGGPQVARDSALAEVANILGSACMSAIGTLTGLRLLPTVPTLLRGEAGRVLADGVAAPAGERVVVLETHFASAGEPRVGGQLLLVLERASSRALLERLGL